MPIQLIVCRLFIATCLIISTGLHKLQAAEEPVDRVPERTDDNLIVATYNIQFFGRNVHDNAKLAKVIQHFDICGIIEIHNEKELPKLVKELEKLTGKDWGYTFGVRTHRPGGSYHEAYGAVWRRDRVEIGDGVTGNIWDLEEIYRNDPFLVAFKRKNFDFVMALIHTRWTDDVEGTRREEVLGIAEHIYWMKSFITERDAIICGDYNYPGTSQVMEQLKIEANLEQLDKDPKTTFKLDGEGFASSYDHMLVPKGQATEYIADSCRALNVVKIAYDEENPMTRRMARRELSDHLPVFAIFDVSGDQDDDPDED